MILVIRRRGLIMTNVYVFSQNLKLLSFAELKHSVSAEDKNVFITTHMLFENEQAYLRSVFCNCSFRKFADYLTDEEMAYCDTRAYTGDRMEYANYERNLKCLKNQVVLKKVLNDFPNCNGYLLCADLGIDAHVWLKAGFQQLSGEYYYVEQPMSVLRKARQIAAKSMWLKRLYKKLKPYRNACQPAEVYVATFEGKKYIFLGKMHRIDYRLDLQFQQSQEEYEKLEKGIFYPAEECVYLTTWHEKSKCQIPDSPKYDVRWMQDGYLPPNYSHYDYSFKPKNVSYFCWDILGTKLFKNKGLPFSMIPFRKKLYLPQPIFPQQVKKVLVVASGSGDWTAMKNRSDDDLMVDAFVQIARRFPDIQFIYRCHPTWIHPQNVGVNSINRVYEYFESVNLPNLRVFSNIPVSNGQGSTFQFSFPRSSLEEEFLDTDLVFGEHSISMIDAAFKRIPFASVNLTNRRNFFIGINELGFPTCDSLDKIAELIDAVTTKDFQIQYLSAVSSYNAMTDLEGE